MELTITGTSAPRVAKDALSADLGDEVVILNVSKGVYYGLENVGYLIWKLIERRHTVGEIALAIVSEFDVDFEQCKRDVIELLKELEREGLIEIP
ncbi:MAG: PqqD family peptide modification chaperone [Chloroflexi bacterium]|nr:PqqD family peptide modification chaperone [Chloroflexota bacterium]